MRIAATKTLGSEDGESDYKSTLCFKCGTSNPLPKARPPFGTALVCSQCHAPLLPMSEAPGSPSRTVQIFLGYHDCSLLNPPCPWCRKVNYAVVSPDKGYDLAWYCNEKPQNPDGFYIDTTCVHCARNFVVEWDEFPIKNPVCNYCSTVCVGISVAALPESRRQEFELKYGHAPQLPSPIKRGNGEAIWIICPRCMTAAISGRPGTMQVAGNFDVPVHEAAKIGDTAAVQQLLKKGANVNAAGRNGVTPLILASYQGHAEVVRLLLAARAKVNAARNDGATALWVASQNGHADVVQLLLAAGANVDAANNDGATPLYIASQNGNADAVKLLLGAGANVNAATNDGATPLMIASQEGHANVVQLLLPAGANVNAASNDGTTPLYLAAGQDHADVVQLLLAAGANVNAARNHGATPLYTASGEGHADIVRLLLSCRANVNAARNDGVTPLYIASQQGHAEVVQLLIAAGAEK